jgi:hypothetical protein
MTSVYRPRPTWALAASLIFACLLFGPASLRSSSSQKEPDPDFTYSKSPKCVVLFVQSLGRNTGEIRAMSLFGDGRLQLSFRAEAKSPESHRDLHLAPSEVDSLLTSAVRHGLADWDSTRIESEKLVATGGKIFETQDGEIVHVTIALTSLRHGDSLEKDVRRTMRVANPGLASRYFPDIEELAGIAELQQYLTAAFSR